MDQPVDIVRSMSGAHDMGGTASLAASGSGDVRSVDVDALRRILQSQGAITS
jgi:hypothetical protein